MKNIHLIPTDKPSRLYTNNGTLHLDKYSRASNGITINQHIYITSDEEIKEGDWIYYTSAIGYCKTTVGSKGLEQEGIPAKKIILTTDQSLDGVQAIDDEFLEWFVKNPSCEEVEVELIEEIPSGFTFGMFGNDEPPTELVYKIIIPKEEPKQETLEEVADTALQDEINYWYHKTGSLTSEDIVRRAYSLGIKESAKWQQERMYSEKEVLELLHKRMIYTLGEEYKKETTLKWFEQFKK